MIYIIYDRIEVVTLTHSTSLGSRRQGILSYLEAIQYDYLPGEEKAVAALGV